VRLVPNQRLVVAALTSVPPLFPLCQPENDKDTPIYVVLPSPLADLQKKVSLAGNVMPNPIYTSTIKPFPSLQVQRLNQLTTYLSTIDFSDRHVPGIATKETRLVCAPGFDPTAVTLLCDILHSASVQTVHVHFSH